MSDLLELLTARDDATEHHLVTFGDMKYVSGSGADVLRVKDEEYPLSGHAFGQICDELGVPSLYAKRCPTDFRNETFNYWIDQRPSAASAFLVRDNAIASFMKPDYSYVPTVAMYDSVVSAFVEDDLEIVNSVIDDAAVELVVFSKLLDANVGNSPVRAGVRVKFSDAWAVAPRFDSYLCRIACFNSAISGLVNRKFRVAGHSGMELIAQSHSFTLEALQSAPKMVHGFEHMLEQKVSNYRSMVTRICEENKLPRKVKNLVLSAAEDAEYRSTLANDNIGSMYEIVNLFTFVASHWQDKLSEAHVLELFEIAGGLMINQKERCNSCGSKKSV